MVVPDGLRTRANKPAAPVLEQVRSFLRGYVSDWDGLTELRADMARTARTRPVELRGKATAIEALLAEPPPTGTLAELVALEANWGLDDTSDAAAAQWLADIARLIHGVLDE